MIDDTQLFQPDKHQENSVVLWVAIASAIGVAGLYTVDKWRVRTKRHLEESTVTDDQPSDAFKGTDDSSVWFSRLKAAPWWASLYSCALYMYLFSVGLAHMGRAVLGVPSYARLRGDMALLVVLYLVECTVAIMLRMSTMRSWRLFDFVVHHLTFASVVGATLALPNLQMRWFLFTFPLDLLTSCNEAAAAARALGMSGAVDIPNRMLQLVVMVALSLAETYELVTAICSPEASLPHRCLFAMGLLAPLYHVTAVIPYCWTVLARWAHSAE